MTELTVRFHQACAFAAASHHGQVRKGAGTIYFAHPLGVASLVLEFGGTEDQAIAALLHDVVEDCGVTVAQVENMFGPRVAMIVDEATDGVPDETGRKGKWRPRKEAYIANLGNVSDEGLLVIACDKLHNVRSTIADLLVIGEKVFDRFAGGRDGTLWYYSAMARRLRDVVEMGDRAPVVVTLFYEVKTLVEKTTLLMERQPI